MRQPLAHLSLRERPLRADDVVAGPAGVAGADLEAGGEDDAIDRILGPVGHDAPLGDTLDAPAVGIDQGHVRPVEGRQVFVMEAGPFAELPVPGLERLSGVRVVNNGLGPGANLIHLLEVEQLHELALLA